jgi:CubicO group peptidase (beta-lactamase class C family)
LSAPEELVRTLELRLASAQSERRLPSVSAAVFRDTEVVWHRAIGLADVSRGEPATPGHAYRIGSITKTFTAVAVMQLREAGRLALDDELAEVVPGASSGATIRMALSHLGGMQREPPGEIWETMIPPTREDLLAGLGDAEQVLEPGAEWHYSNLAFALLGEVVMRVSGTTYSEYLRTEILDPLGLVRTRLQPEGPRATPYFVEPYSDAVRIEPDPEVTESTGAAGWLWSTPSDLARWGAFLASGDDRVLPLRVLDEMARVRAMVDEKAWSVGWGLGLELYRRGDRVFVGHGGAMPGFLAAVVVLRDECLGAAVLTNSGAGGGPEALALDLAEAGLDGLPSRPSEWRPAASPPVEIEPLLGRWWTEGVEVVLSWRNDGLEAELVGGAVGRRVSELAPEGVDRWRVTRGRERGEVLRVVRGESGAVTKLYFATYPLTREPSTFG